jgi:ABC-2 type transport system permease protein
MTGVWTIASRELRSFFRVPLGWVAMAMYLLLAGALFSYGILTPGAAATLRGFFGFSAFLLLPVIPAITMKLLSEEIRQGTIEPLMTSPVSDWAIVLGKYLGAAIFLLVLLAPTLLHAIVLWAFSDPRPDLGPIIAGYLSLLLLGATYLGAGLFVSSFTANQTLAYLGTFLLLLAMLLLGSDAIPIPRTLGAIATALAMKPRLTDFAKGVVDTSHIIYFLSLSAWFLVLAGVSLESRRWR